MRTSVTFILALLLATVAAAARGAAPLLRGELPNLCVHALAQDADGYVWIGTSNGLCRSLGDEYEIYFGDPSDAGAIPSGWVTGLDSDSEGWLYIATNAGLCIKAPGENCFRRVHLEGSDDNQGLCFHGFVRSGLNVYAYGEGGMYSLDKEAGRVALATPVEGEAVMAGVQGFDGRVWLANGSSLMGLDSNMRVAVRTSVDGDCRVRALAPSGRYIMVGTSHGLWRLDPADLTLAPTGISGDIEVNGILTLPDGVLLLSTGNAGVLAYDPRHGTAARTYARYDFTTVPSSEINCVFQDRNLNLWVATFDSGEKLLTGRSGMFNADRALVDAFRPDFVTRLVRDPRGNLWAGTRSEGLAVYCPANGSHLHFNSRTHRGLAPYAHDLVQELSIDPQGRLWTGYSDALLVARPRYDGTDTPVGVDILKEVPLNANVVSIAHDSLGHTWVGTDTRGLFVMDADADTLSHIAVPLIRANNITKVIPYGKDYMLFASYDDGLYLVDCSRYKLRTYQVAGHPVWTHAVDLLADNAGNLWVGTYNQGLIRVDGGNGQCTVCVPPPCDIVAVAQDHDGDIWASSSYGLYRLDRSGGMTAHYLRSDGLGGNQFHEKCKAVLPDGRVLFGGNSGLEEVNAYNGRRRSPALDVSLLSVTVHPGGNTATNPGIQRLSLDHTHNTVTLDYCAPAYEQACEVEYACMLEGRDKDFIDNGTLRRVTYSSLAPGRYIFKVKARYKGKEWQPAVQLASFTVAPHPMLSWPAIVLYVLLVLGACAEAVRLYLRYRLVHERYVMAEQRLRAPAAMDDGGVRTCEEETDGTRQQMAPLDKEFIDRLYTFIDGSLSNSELNVNMLGRELGYSRTNFYRKVKSLTGLTPNDLLRLYRLDRAAELLLTRRHSIGEVSEMTGFGNQSHFSSLFKKHFGLTPKAYVASHFPTDPS